MRAALKDATVRFYKSRPNDMGIHEVVGAGVLVSPQHILTCAHVVNDALGVERECDELPTAEITLGFLTKGEPTRRAKVVNWLPVAADGSGDIALLELLDSKPEDAKPVRLIKDYEPPGDDRFDAFGFPVKRDFGMITDGVIKGSIGRGWVQLEAFKTEGMPISGGFSGGPVWSREAEGVVGIIVGADTDKFARVAFMIPASLILDTWPELSDYTIPPSPYRGLEAFRAEDADDFFGREKDVEALLEDVHKKPLVAVIGNSGSGKSSVVFAGLVAKLRPEPDWLIASFRPQNRPYDELAAALLPLLEENLSERARLKETKDLAADFQSGALTVADVIRRILQKHPGKRLLLIADQFEELYTLNPDKRLQQAFIDQLLGAVGVRNSPGFTLVLTMRADFMSFALEHRPFADALQHATRLLGAMSKDELRAAIEKPAKKAGVKLEPGFADLILRDVGEEPGNLPLMQFALKQLWEKQEGHTLTVAAYQEIGGIGEALARYADEVYKNLDEAEQDAVRRVLVQLVRPGEGTEDTRQVATKAQIGEANWPLVSKLADSRLVVTGAAKREAVQESGANEETVEVVHEALIRHWQTFRDWMNEAREFRRWQNSLRQNLTQWQQSGQEEDLLLRGTPLDVAEEMLARYGMQVSEDEKHYIENSVGLREEKKREAQRQREEREREQRERLQLQRRNIRHLRAFLGMAASLLVMAVALGSVAWFQRYNALQAQQIALSRKLASDANLAANLPNSANGTLDRALLLSIEAGQVSNHPGTWSSLMQTAQAKPEILTFLHRHTNWVRSVAFNHDGTSVVSGGDDGTVILWDVSDAQNPVQPRPLEGHTGRVRSVAFNHDGTTVVSGGDDGTVILWDVSDAQNPVQLRGHTGPVLSVAFNHDGTRVVSGSDDRTLILWDISNTQNPVQPRPLEGHTGSVRSVAFNHDGTRVVSGSDDRTLILWDVSDEQNPVQLSSLEGHTGPVLSVAFNHDGTRVVSGSRDPILILWDVDVDSLLEKSCRRAGRNLTQAEWQRYMGDIPYRETCSQYL
jgi:hypothetical protein